MSQIPAKYANKYFFHFTHIDNLASIIDNGLLCTNIKNEKKLDHFNVASSSIQERRSNMEVTCEPRGFIHDYVPFYFCSVNPMFLYMVNTKNIDQHDMIILAVPIEKILEEDVVFTDASANTNEPPTFYSDPSDLDKLNWVAIDSQKWSCSSDRERHQKMAEVLIHEKVEIDDVQYIIVWNESVKEKVLKLFNERDIIPPHVDYSPFKKLNFFYLKFMVKGQELRSLVTGPRILKERFEHIVETLINDRGARDAKEYLFSNITDGLTKIRQDFCAVKELADIYKLETINDVHTENVGDHTNHVIEELKKTEYYIHASDGDQKILELSAYFHDIGKGPASKWRTGKQPAYPDHPADGALMIGTILHRDFDVLTDYEIRMICLLVIYHDLIGEIFGKNRDKKQLIDIIDSAKEFDMLATLNKADVAAISWEWHLVYNGKIKNFRTEILAAKGL